MPEALFKHQFKAMGGPCQCHLWHVSKSAADRLFQALEQEVLRLERKYSRFRADSLLSQINLGQLNGQTLDEETRGLFNFAQDCFELSGHVFDLTVGSLRKVWNYNSGTLPNSDELESCLTRIGWNHLNWNGQSLIVPNGMELDLGGLVKEFAVDRLIGMLKEHRISGLVNLAGDIGVSAPNCDGSPWRIAISHPREQGAIAWVALKEGAIAGSGDYERFMIVDGVRYSHILRPDTGYPAEDSLSSVSVIADQCLLAGSVSTIAMLKGSGAKQWLDEMALPYLAFDQALVPFGTVEVQ